MEGVMTHVTEQYRVGVFKPIKITQSGPPTDNLGRQYIFVIIYYMDVPCTIAQHPFLTSSFSNSMANARSTCPFYPF